MSKPRVYIETTIPSFYHETRTAPDIVARRRRTRKWWGGAPERYELVTSSPVLDGLAGGPRERIAKRLTLVRELLEENAGVATALVGITGLDPDTEILRLEQIGRAGLEPRISGLRMKAVLLQRLVRASSATKHPKPSMWR